MTVFLMALCLMGSAAAVSLQAGTRIAGYILTEDESVESASVSAGGVLFGFYAPTWVYAGGEIVCANQDSCFLEPGQGSTPLYFLDESPTTTTQATTTTTTTTEPTTTTSEATTTTMSTTTTTEPTTTTTEATTTTTEPTTTTTEATTTTTEATTTTTTTEPTTTTTQTTSTESQTTTTQNPVIGGSGPGVGGYAPQEIVIPVINQPTGLEGDEGLQLIVNGASVVTAAGFLWKLKGVVVG